MGINLNIDQEKDYNDVTNELKNNNKVALIRPTGTGKSIIVLKFIENNEGKKVLYLAPSVSILHQVKENIIKYGVKCLPNLKRMSYQKLSKLDNNELKSLNPDIIILDEFHHCGAPVWGQSVENLCNMFPNTQVIGLSATPIRYFDGNVDIAEEMFGEHVVSNISFYEAVEQGILPQFEYISAMYGYEDKLIKMKEQIENSNSASSKIEESKRLFEDLSKRLDKDTENLPEILKKHMTVNDGKYMVFCSNIEEMQKKIKEAEKLFSKVNPNLKIYSVNADKGLKENQKTLRQFERDNEENFLKLIFSVNMLNEGYHLPDIDGVIMMRPTKSPTVYQQQLGRALTVGNSSKKPVIIDLVDNFDSIKVIEKVVEKLNRNNNNQEKNKFSHNIEKFKIIDYTRHIGEISEKIEKLSKGKTLAMEDKIDLFERFIKENPDESIHSDTIFEGYPIGQYLLQIRQSVIYDKNTIRYSDEDKKKLEELGLLYKRFDNIEAKVEKLRIYCEKHPYVFSNMKRTRERLQIEGKKDELEELEELYQSSYQYIISRKSKGKLSKEVERELEKIKIGGVFGIKEEDLIWKEKYGISKKIIIQLIQDFGSLENFKEAYINLKVELAKAENMKIKEEILRKNPQILEYMKVLPIVRYYGLGEDAYNKLVKDAFRMEIKDGIASNALLESEIVIDGQIKKEVDATLDSCTEKEKKVIELRYGLKDKKTRTLKEVGASVGNQAERIRQIEAGVKRKLRTPYKRYQRLREYIFEPTEEFIRTYFKMHDIFVGENEPALDKEEIDKLIGMLEEQKREKEEKKSMAEEKQKKEEKKSMVEEKKEEERKTEVKENPVDEIRIIDIGLSTRGTNCLIRNGITSIEKLLDKIEREDELSGIQSMGKKTEKEIIDKVHSLGFKFKFESEQEVETEENPMNNIEYLNLQIMNCEEEIKTNSKKVEKLETQKIKVKEKIEKLINQIDAMTDGNMNQENLDTVMQIVKLLGEQKKTIKILDEKLKEMQKIETLIREEIKRLQESISSISRGGE